MKRPTQTVKRSPIARLAPRLGASTALLLLAACGGGNGELAGPLGSTREVMSNPGTSKPVSPPLTGASFSGTAATGAAMPGAIVRVKCAAGGGMTAAANNGDYSLSLLDATLPCVASATSVDGATVLHSLVSAEGGRRQALNFTPLTQLVVARVAAADPAAFFAGFDGAARARVSQAGINQAVEAVVSELKQGGIDASALGNPITAALVAKQGDRLGNAHDQVLDRLAEKLAMAGSTLGELTQTLAGGDASREAATEALNGRPSAGQLLQPAHADCPALRSGSYRWVFPNNAPSTVPGTSATGWRTELAQLDAPALKFTWSDGSQATGASLSGCRFTALLGKAEIVVSPAGVIVMNVMGSSGASALSFAFPEQRTRLADLQGAWQALELKAVAVDAASTTSTTTTEATSSAATTAVSGFSTFELNAVGQTSSAMQCLGAVCTPQTGAAARWRLNPAGGFDRVDTVGLDSRAFAFKPADGAALLVQISAGRLSIASPQRRLPLPAVGSVVNFWDIAVPGAMSGSITTASTPSGFAESQTTVLAVDAATQSFTRQRLADGRVDAIAVNQPRDGLRWRAAGSSATTAGTRISFPELIGMPLAGTGLSVYAGTGANAVLGLTVSRPN